MYLQQNWYLCDTRLLSVGHNQFAGAGSGPLARQFARMALAGLPRGGGDGDAIRMGILNVMRDNGIREGHRPVRRLHHFLLLHLCPICGCEICAGCQFWDCCEAMERLASGRQPVPASFCGVSTSNGHVSKSMSDTAGS